MQLAVRRTRRWGLDRRKVNRAHRRPSCDRYAAIHAGTCRQASVASSFSSSSSDGRSLHSFLQLDLDGKGGHWVKVKQQRMHEIVGRVQVGVERPTARSQRIRYEYTRAVPRYLYGLIRSLIMMRRRPQSSPSCV
jgi:hypothetical protein